MALNWNISNIENYKELYEEFEQDGETYYRFNDVTETIMMLTMVVGINRITDKNYKQFYNRVLLYSRITNADNSDITIEAVRRHIGLETNASTMTKAKFKSFLFKIFENDNGEI